MARSLCANVWVGSEFFAAGSTPPAQAARLITNPKAWGEEPEPSGEAPAKKAAASKSKK